MEYKYARMVSSICIGAVISIETPKSGYSIDIRFIRCFVPTTATGLFSAMILPISNAVADRSANTDLSLDSPMTSFLPPGTTSLTNPIALASSALNRRPVSASSRAFESFPTILGKRWRVPISAARPTLTSYVRVQIRPITVVAG